MLNQNQESSETAREEKTAPFLSHLLELRSVLIKSALAVVIVFFTVYTLLIEKLMDWIVTPIRDRGVEIIYTAMSEALVTKFKVALIAAAVVVSPFIMWQVWSFVEPALYDHEKKSFLRLFFIAVALFLLGVCFCYSAVYLLAVDFFLVAGDNLAVPLLSIDKYVSFLFGFIVPFGVAFQLPVFLYITTKAGLTNYEMLASKRKYVILAIFVLAAILTPPDVVSQIALGVPMLLLYEVGTQVSRLTKPKQ